MAMTEPLGPGCEILGYRLERVLGRGGMGTVFLATQLSLGRQVALKVLHPQKVGDPQAAAAFFAEARAAGRLTHAHLVTVHDLVMDPARGLYCYAMEYVPGGTVEALVTEDGPLTRITALGIIREIAGALAEAHRQGFIHRDVKPANILITRTGQAKLLDLGLAANRLGPLGGASLTPGGRRLSVVGTPEYMAPEQGRNPDDATPASDVWSLGATLVYLMTGKTPFAGSTVIDLIVRAAMDPLELPEDFPSDLTALLGALMAKVPGHRPRDGQAVVDLLQRLEEGQFPKPGTTLEHRPKAAKPPSPKKPPVSAKPLALPLASPLRRRPPVRRRLR